MTDKFTMPTEDSIRKAAEKCPEAKCVLEELFPKAFGDEGRGSGFKAGDIVRHVDHGMGVVKRVEYDGNDIGVEWIKSARSFHSLSDFAHPDHGWWVLPGNLTLVYRPKECC